jgi:predicted nucleic acid-binding OB-fold protein
MRENPFQHLRSMPAQGPTGSENPEEGPLHHESSVLVLDVLDRIPSGFEIQGLSKPSMYLVRARIEDETVDSPGEDIEISSGSLGPLSEIRFRDLTAEASNDLNDAIVDSINSDPERHLGFYNRANNLSLKYHAFQLLPGIGNSKAIQMVKERGASGWSSFEQIDKSCGIESVRLLAERYQGEMNDPSESPSLLELLVRSEI